MPAEWPSAGALYVFLILYAAACLGAFLAALFFMLLKFYAEEWLRIRHEEARDTSDVRPETDEGEAVQSQTIRIRKRPEGGPVYAVLLLAQFFLGVCLVLVFLSCNVHLCVSAITGGTLGLLVNTWRGRRRTGQRVEHFRS